jgi:hypothetical protein
MILKSHGFGWLTSAQAAKKELLDLKTRGEKKYREEKRRWSDTSWTQQVRSVGSFLGGS